MAEKRGKKNEKFLSAKNKIEEPRKACILNHDETNPTRLSGFFSARE